MKYLIVFALIGLLSCGSNDQQHLPEPAENKTKAKGEILFNSSCAQCHKPDADLTGPALKGARSRWQNKELLYEFVRNPGAVMLKDPYAKSLLQKYSSMMTPSPDLSNEDIDAILNYCDTYTQ